MRINGLVEWRVKFVNPNTQTDRGVSPTRVIPVPERNDPRYQLRKFLARQICLRHGVKASFLTPNSTPSPDA